MILKSSSVFLIFTYLIPNILSVPHTKTIKQNINLSFSTSFTIDEDILEENVDVNPKITNRRHIAGINEQPQGKFKILNRPTMKHKKPVIFPNNDRPVITHTPKWGTQKCNQKSGNTYCEKVSDYPDEAIRNLMSRNEIDLTNRIDIGNDLPLCMSRSKAVTPEKGETEEGDWFFILKGQTVIVDECISPNSACQVLTGLTTKCEQRETIRKLYAYDDRDKEIREMKFKFPSCCMCMVYNAHSVKKRNTELARSTKRRHRRHSLHKEEREKRNAFTRADTKRAEKGISLNPDFAYPDQVSVLLTHKQPPVTMHGLNNIKCAQKHGSTLCTSVDGYPKKYITNLIQRGAFQNSSLFGSDRIEVEIFTRIDGEDKSPMCGAQPRVIFPEAAKTSKDEWKIVVQDQERGFVQGVIVEECATMDSPCNFASSFPPNYKTACKQKYIYRQLEMIDSDGKRSPDITPIPSCCVCHVKSVGNIVVRKKDKTPV